MSAVLEVRGLEKAFGGIRAVNGVSFEVREGEILGLIGPNGSGKSTLFNCILGQLAPSSGEVRVDGRAITGMRPATRVFARPISVASSSAATVGDSPVVPPTTTASLPSVR